MERYSAVVLLHIASLAVPLWRKPMRITLIGYGRMGQAVERVAQARGHTVVGVIRRETPPEERLTLAQQAEVLIDFSHATAVPHHIELALTTQRPLVIGTTGWDSQREQYAQRVREAGGAVLYAPNFSIAVQVFLEQAVALAARLLQLEGWDLAIEEIHHRAKADAPSGTARALAQRLQQTLGKAWSAHLPEQGRLPEDQFHVSAVRVGHEFGTHRLLLDGPYDFIELTHRAKSREGFAYGAVRASEWLRGRKGFFAFNEVLNEILSTGRID